MFLLPPPNLQRKETKLFYFVLSLLTSPKQSRKIIKQVLNFFPTIGLIAPIKNNKQNVGENIIQVGFTKPALKFCD